MHTLTYLLFGFSAAAMFAVLMKSVAVLNLLIVERRSSEFFSELNGRWRLMFVVAPVFFFSSLAALTHIMGERGVSLVVYGAFGVSSTLMIVGFIAIVSALQRGFRSLSPLGWSALIAGPTTFFTSLAALIHVVSQV